jgi:predicted DCC family thiol-disulfide oxidoreductase YuxK
VSTGWTGGQYSVFRALLGAASVAASLRFALTSAPSVVTALLGMAAVFALLLAAGYHDREAALALLAIGGYLSLRRFLPPSPGLAYVGAALLAHACVPAAPYGSWAARGRADPAGSWRLPASVWLGAWIAASAPLVPLLLRFRARPWIWMASLAAHATLILLLGFHAAIAGAVLLHVLLFDPAWIPPLGFDGPDAIYYDGHCGLCHRSVRLVLAEDVAGAFRFAPLESAAFEDALPEPERARLPDSLVVRRADGVILVRSRAVRHILLRLGGMWRALAVAAGALPGRVLDRTYDGVARVRRKLFAPPAEACPLIPALLRSRFQSS